MDKVDDGAESLRAFCFRSPDTLARAIDIDMLGILCLCSDHGEFDATPAGGVVVSIRSRTDDWVGQPNESEMAWKSSGRASRWENGLFIIHATLPILRATSCTDKYTFPSDCHTQLTGGVEYGGRAISRGPKSRGAWRPLESSARRCGDKSQTAFVGGVARARVLGMGSAPGLVRLECPRAGQMRSSGTGCGAGNQVNRRPWPVKAPPLAAERGRGGSERSWFHASPASHSARGGCSHLRRVDGGRTEDGRRTDGGPRCLLVRARLERGPRWTLKTRAEWPMRRDGEGPEGWTVITAVFLCGVNIGS
ncbi:hypothetical protein BJ875DRAFT_446096 [Amylocarpus encephaloides]|uniref:Uncharacterized protein n=1 Tax=Amylocarpus encephaloides TaxID=45428 RepID=A0A9P8C0V5_9HELO|nr:hypothetical protein BJ875DRAFT_446096 [Amylocarpus encephaloides]